MVVRPLVDTIVHVLQPNGVLLLAHQPRYSVRDPSPARVTLQLASPAFLCITAQRGRVDSFS